MMVECAAKAGADRVELYTGPYAEMFEENPEVRSAITRYMASFEELIEKAQNSDQKDILLPVLMGSDAGRLSMILTGCLAPRKKGEKA